MLKSLLLTLFGICAATTASYALEDGDYVYTRDARYQVSLESTNHVVNGYFTDTDVTSSTFGWTASDGSTLNTSYIGVEPSSGPNGENMLLSSSVNSDLYQAVPFSGGRRYIIQYTAKAASGLVTVYGSSSANNLINIYAVKDAAGDLDDDNNYQQISGYNAIGTSWTDVTYAFTDESGEDGYLVFKIGSLEEGTYIGNFEVRECDAISDDREISDFLETGRFLVDSGYFTEDTGGFVEAFEEVYAAFNEAPEAFDNIDDASSMIDQLGELQDAWFAENTTDVSSLFTSFNTSSWSKFNPNSGKSSYGSWTLEGCDSRWAHTSDADLARSEYPGGGTYTLVEGKAYLSKSGLPAGNYLFSIDSYAVAYISANGYDSATDNYVPDYNEYATGAYVFFGSDTLFIDSLNNYSAETYYIFHNLEDGEKLVAGIYFPGFTAGGVFYFGAASLNYMGILSDEDLGVEDEEYVIAYDETLLLDASTTYTAGETIESEHMSITFGNGDTFTTKTYSTFPEPFYAYVTGTANPKGGDDSSTAYSVSNMTVPNTGCYFIVKSSVPGTLRAGVIINNGKSFYVTKSDGTLITDKTLRDGSGTKVTLDDNYQLDSKLYGEVYFDIEADESYYIFVTGSKISFAGCTLAYLTEGEEDDSDGISTIKASESEDAPLYNLAGQKVGETFKGLVIQNGKKRINK